MTTTQDYTTLAVGLDLDASVAERVMGWSPMTGALRMYWDGRRARYLSDTVERRESRGIYYHPALFAPSTGVAAAWEVVERLHALGWQVRVTRNLHTDSTTVEVSRGVIAPATGAAVIVETCETTEEAICRAALAVVAAEER